MIVQSVDASGGGYDSVRTHVLDTSIRSLVTGASGRVVSTDVFMTQL